MTTLAVTSATNFLTTSPAPVVETAAGYTYDTYGRVSAVTAQPSDGQTAQPAIATYAYLPNSNLLASTTFANGVTAIRNYEPNRDLITSIENKKNDGTVISTYGYTNDANGRRTIMAKAGTAFATPDQISYGYNTRSEVTSATSTANAAYNFAYNFDSIGNRISAIESGTNNTYIVNELNQYTGITSTSHVSSFQFQNSPTYDLDGNQLTLVNQTGTWTLTYNAENRPIVMESATTRIENSYDYMGRRIEKKVFVGTISNWRLTTYSKFLYNDYLQVAELDALNDNAINLSYIWDMSISRSNRLLTFTTHHPVSHDLATYFYIYDGNKNVTELISASSNDIVAHYEYSPFGMQTIKTGMFADLNRFRFSNELYDIETGLLCYNYRFYNAIEGRWTSRDPIGELQDDFYVFADNNGINNYDKNGLLTCNEKILDNVDPERLRYTNKKTGHTWIAAAMTHTNRVLATLSPKKCCLPNDPDQDKIQWELKGKTVCCTIIKFGRGVKHDEPQYSDKYLKAHPQAKGSTVLSHERGHGAISQKWITKMDDDRRYATGKCLSSKCAILFAAIAEARVAYDYAMEDYEQDIYDVNQYEDESAKEDRRKDAELSFIYANKKVKEVQDATNNYITNCLPGKK